MNDFEKILIDAALDGRENNYQELIGEVTPAQVREELAKEPGKFSRQRLLRLISPAAQNLLEEMAQQARELTLKRFGKTMQLYVPMYVSNFCINGCEYCGFNQCHDFKRVRLSIDQACADADVIAKQGFRHILILSGEDPKYIDVEYLSELSKRLRKKFCAVEIEIYPMSQDEYVKLFKSGIDGISIYQETYDRELYKKLHPTGPKRDYSMRLKTPDYAAQAGFRRLGIGALLGLKDWRVETLALGEHAAYLMKKYWRSQVTFSFPRMRPAQDVDEPVYDNIISDKHFVQMMLALRLCFSDAGITISTRESSEFRKHLIKLCVTKVSAGSKTNPGGYSGDDESVSQFEIDDKSSPKEVAQMLKDAGYEAVWKDWDAGFVDGAEVANETE